MNAIKEMEELKHDNDDEDKDKDKESQFSDISDKGKKIAKRKADGARFDTKGAKNRVKYFSKNDKFYQQEVQEVERINKALCNKDIHLDMKVIRRAVLMYRNDN
mmetsp:Transcript_10260/g.9064  ORF Transcript_10260/g.9064 Transcript_10260/m.9064 type:complete len:104 (-) Transcript_10260:41-352(-)